jgi:hypothetical protein
LNLLDENFPGDQAALFREWRIPFRKIGREVARLGFQDPEIIPLLHRLRGVTFFSQDHGFCKEVLCHPAYCLVWLNVRPDDAAFYVRRFLKQPGFNSQTKRMGSVVRAHHGGLEFWRRNQPGTQHADWIDGR